MAYTILNQILGVTKIGNIDNPQAVPLGTIVEAVDPVYGSGLFIYLQGVASLAVGDVVTYNGLTGAVTRWAGTANSGAPLAVSMSANTSASAYSWYQIEGNAVVNITGTVAAGDRAFFASTATLQSTLVAGKQVLECVAVTANGVPATGQATYTISTPFAQGNIT